MRKHASELTLFTLIALIMVGAIGYFLYLDFTAGDAAGEPPGRVSDARGEPPGAGAGEPAAGRSARILTCKGPDGGVFYTNATSCEAADLDNRITVVAAPDAELQSGMGRNCLSAEGERVHQFLANCHEPFNEALRVERWLAEADDPVNSRHAETYCALIAEGVQNGCTATNAQFCYLRVCQLRLETVGSEETAGSQ